MGSTTRGQATAARTQLWLLLCTTSGTLLSPAVPQFPKFDLRYPG